jgi:hypothetical protein
MTHGQNKHQRRRVIRQSSGFIYVIEFSTGLIKVGMTKDGDNRLKQHAKAAHQQKSSILDHWISSRHKGYQENEASLISFCLKHYGPPAHGKETFASASFETTVSFAQSLSFPELTEADISALIRREDAALQRGNDEFHAHQVRQLRTEVELINSLANSDNRWQTHDAHFSVAERLMALTPAAWHDENREAVCDYLAVKTGRPADRERARQFEISMRALFAMDLKREPMTFAELAAYIDSCEVSQ